MNSLVYRVYAIYNWCHRENSLSINAVGFELFEKIHLDTKQHSKRISKSLRREKLPSQNRKSKQS